MLSRKISRPSKDGIAIYAGRRSLSGFWRSNNYNWYLHDNLFYLDLNPKWPYVEKIDVKVSSENLGIA
jgi:hypothetical protein